MHTDKEIKSWVCTHIHQLVSEHCPTGANEFNVPIQLADKEGTVHDYTVFLEFSELSGEENWVVRNIVRPEQLQ